MDPVIEKKLRKMYNAAAALGVLFITSVFLYALIAEFIHDGYVKGYEFPKSTDDGNYTILRYLLMFVVSALCLALVKYFSQTEKFLSKAASPFQALLAQSVVINAICESPALVGLLLYLIAGNLWDPYIFGLISLILFALFFPRYNRWAAWIESLPPDRVNIEFSDSLK